MHADKTCLRQAKSHLFAKLLQFCSLFGRSKQVGLQKTAVKKRFFCKKVDFATKKLSISVDFFVDMLYNIAVLIKMKLYA